MPVETQTQRSQKTPQSRQFGNSLIIFITVLLLLNFILLPALRPRLPLDALGKSRGGNGSFVGGTTNASRPSTSC